MTLKRGFSRLLGRLYQVPDVLWGLALACLLAAAGLVAVSLFAPSTAALTAEAPGVVSDVRVKTETDEDGEQDKTYRPYLSFEDDDHVAHTSPSVVTSSKPLHQVGEQVTVLYDPWHPDDRCVIKGEEGVPAHNVMVLRHMASACLVIAAACIAFGLARRWD